MSKEPLLKIQYRDPVEDFEGMLVIDTLVKGVAGGGLRVTKSVTLNEVERLAKGMTLKNAMMGLPLGGGKSAIRYDPRSPNLEDALVRFFEFVGPICETMYGFGPDMNTPPDLCDAVAKRVGLKSRHTALAESSPYGYEGIANYDKALRLQAGPLTILDARTAVGVAGAASSAAALYDFPSSFRFAVQGFGSVGMGVVHYLTQEGHRCVGVADAGGTYLDSEGLDFATLQNAKAGRYEIDPAKVKPGTHVGDCTKILGVDCDVLILAATPDAVAPHNMGTLNCKMIVEGGNFAVAPAAHQPLQDQGIPIVPDFIASGGAIATVSGIIQLGWSIEPSELLGEIKNRVVTATEKATQIAQSQGCSLREAGVLLLEQQSS